MLLSRQELNSPSHVLGRLRAGVAARLVHQTQRSNLLKRCRARLLNHALVLSLRPVARSSPPAGPSPGAGLDLQSRLDDERGLERPDHVAGPCLGCKPEIWSRCRWVATTAITVCRWCVLDVLGDVHRSVICADCHALGAVAMAISYWGSVRRAGGESANCDCGPGAAWLGRRVEQAIFRQPIEPRLLPVWHSRCDWRFDISAARTR